MPMCPVMIVEETHTLMFESKFTVCFFFFFPKISTWGIEWRQRLCLSVDLTPAEFVYWMVWRVSGPLLDLTLKNCVESFIQLEALNKTHTFCKLKFRWSHWSLPVGTDLHHSWNASRSWGDLVVRAAVDESKLDSVLLTVSLFQFVSKNSVI